MKEFNMHGGYFAPTGFLKVEAGGSHEENPNGGVQIGVDPQGVPNMLEEGEPLYNDYVYSDNIYADGGILEKHNLPKNLAGKLYSDIAEKLIDTDRPLDAIAGNGMEVMLTRLADAQEEQKAIEQQKELEKALAQMTPEEIEELGAMLEEQAVAEQQAMPVQSEMVPQEQPVPIMACGGKVNRYPDGGYPVMFGQNNIQALRNAFPGVFGQTKLPDYLHYSRDIQGPVMFGEDNHIQAFRNAYPGIYGNTKLPDYLHYSVNIPGGEIQHSLVNGYRAEEEPAQAPFATWDPNGYLTDWPDKELMFYDKPNNPFTVTLPDGTVPRASKTPQRSNPVSNPAPARTPVAAQPQPAQPVRQPWGYKIENPGMPVPTNQDAIEFNTVPVVLTDDGSIESINDVAASVLANYPASNPVGESVVTENISNNPAALPTGLMYAGPLGSTLLALQTALQEPDKYRVPHLQPVTPEGRIHLQNQRYNPIDQNMIANTMLAQGNATARGLRNSGLGPSSAAAQLAADYNLGRNLGTGFIQAWDANNQHRNNVIAANNQAEAQRAQFDYAVDAARKQALNQAAFQNAQYDLMGQRLNNQAESEKYAAMSANLSNALQALSNIGRQNFIMNQVNSNRALYDRVMPNGWAYYNPATYGGFIKKCKK